MTKILTTILAFFLLVACGPTVPPEFVTTDELSQNPGQYENQTLTLDGNLVSVGITKTFFVAYPYYNPATKTTSISLSQVSETFYGFRSTDDKTDIQIYKRSGGLYLPIPIVPAGSSKITSNPVRIIGYWFKTNDGTYLLRVYSSEDLITPTPAR